MDKERGYMKIDVKCEITPELVEAEYKEINKQIEDENKNSLKRRIFNWILLIAIDICILLYTYRILNLTEPTNTQIVLPYILLGPAFWISVLLIFKARGTFLGIKKNSKYLHYEKMQEVTLFRDLSKKTIVNVTFQDSASKDDLEVVITYADSDRIIKEEKVRDFKKIEVYSSDKYMIDFDERTVSVPYVYN